MVAARLKVFNFPSAAEDSPLVGIDPGTLPNLYFLAVAICHQTTPRTGPRLGGYLDNGDQAWGWDYLRLRLAERVATTPTISFPTTWATFSDEELASVFADAHGTRTLSDIGGRAALVRDLGTSLARTALTSVRTLFDDERGVLDVNGRGLLHRLQTFRAYRDPVRKKSYYFLELMKNSCGWTFADPQHLGAPVDYHETRGHLRLGTVVIENAALLTSVEAGVTVDQTADLGLRGAIATAIRRISDETGRSASDLHYLFWNVFRNCCGRTVQHCSACPSDCGLPDRYRVPSETWRACMFTRQCASASKEEKLSEHVHETDFY